MFQASREILRPKKGLRMTVSQFTRLYPQHFFRKLFQSGGLHLKEHTIENALAASQATCQPAERSGQGAKQTVQQIHDISDTVHQTADTAYDIQNGAHQVAHGGAGGLAGKLAKYRST